jgi:hypothetical protein
MSVNRTRLAVAGLVLVMVTSCGSDSTNAKDSGAAFCAAAREAKASTDNQQKLFDAQDAPGPAKVQPAIEDFAAKFALLPALAPAEIKSDVEGLNEGAQALLAIVQANNYDVVKMVPTPEFGKLNQVFASAEYQAARKRFQTYLDTKCAPATTTPGT